MFKTIRNLKDVGFDKQLNELTNKLPENRQICKRILEKLNNKQVNIKEDNGKEASLYIVMTNTILIANINASFTRVQTIAHECLHSIQNKKILWFNFIFSNIYLLYFLIISILGILNVTNSLKFGILLILAGFTFYAVRSYLEMDAMVKARYVAEDYLNEHSDILTKEEINLILSKYDYINDAGIRITLMILFLKCIIRLLVFGIICLI